MYTHANILDKLLEESEQFIMENDRSVYRGFFEEAEKFCVANNVILGGSPGLGLLTGRKLSVQSFSWDLYTESAYETSKRLAMALSKVHSPHVPIETVVMTTNILHKEFTLTVNARALFNIYALEKYKGVKLSDIMGPVEKVSYFAKLPIMCIPGEMQIISAYHILYSPDKVGQWKDVVNDESELYALLVDTLRQKATAVRGGGANVHRTVADARRVIVNKLIGSSDNVLTGDRALTMLGLNVQSEHVEFITGTDIDELLSHVTAAVKKILGASGQYKLTYVSHRLNIPDDFQLKKYTIYLVDGKSHTPIADVFNSSQYEMIPYINVGKFKVGNPWVLLRFMFIKIWTLRMILNASFKRPDIVIRKITTTITNCDRLRKMIYNGDVLAFQSVDYTGIYINEYVAKKQFIKNIGKRFQPFYPAKVDKKE